MILLFVIFFCVCLWLCVIMWRKNRKQKSETAPSLPNPLGLVWRISTSNLKDIFKEIVKVGQCTEEHGGVTKIDTGIVSVYFITSPEDASTVLYQCAEKSFVYDLIKPYVGSQLVAASVPVFKRNKRIMELAMKSTAQNEYLVIFNKHSKRLVDVMDRKLNVDYDFSHIITRSILEMVSQTTMGKKLDGEDIVSDRYVNAVDKELEILLNRVKYPWLFFDVFFNMSKLKKEQDEALEIIFGLSDKMIQLRKEEHFKRLQYKEFTEGDFKSFLELVIKNTVTEDSEMYTNEELRNLVDNIMLASFDTSAAVMTFILICLGSYPRVQEKLIKELNKVISPKGRPITKEDFSQLTYLEAVIKETLRLYPVGPVLARRSHKDIKLGKYILPAASQVVVHVWAINRNKVHWGADAEEFRPERWLDPSTLPSHTDAFATFSPGRRYCIGKTYAMNLLKIITGHIIQRYKVTADVSKLEMEFVVLLKPVAGHMIRIEERS